MNNQKFPTFLVTLELTGATKVAVEALLDAGLEEDGKDGGGFISGARDFLLVAGILNLYAERNRQKSNSDCEVADRY